MVENPHENLGSKLFIWIIVLLPIFFILVSAIGSQKNSEQLISVPVEKLRRICRGEDCYIEARIPKSFTAKTLYLPDVEGLKEGDMISVKKICNEFDTRKPCKYEYEKSTGKR